MVALLLLSLLSPPAVLAEKVTLNLKDADIEALITTVAEATGTNFIVDPRVKGRVTVISSAELEREELYQVFLSILRVHGFTAVPTGSVVKVIPDTNAKQEGPVSAEAHGEEMVTRVLQVRHIEANQLVPLLRPLVLQQGHLAAFADSNVLVVADYASNIERLERIIARIDVAGDSEIEVIRLEHAFAPDVVRVLTSLGGGRALPEGTPGGGRNNLVADERTNSILIGGTPAARLRLRSIITHLDTPLERNGNTRVIYLHYAQAEEMAKVLSGAGVVEEGVTGGAKGASGNEVKIQADAQTNALVITAPPDVQRSLEAVIRKLDIRRAQVLVEGVIAEVTENRLKEIGIQWRTNDRALTSTGQGIGTFGGTSLPGTDLGSINAFPGDPATLGQGFSLGFFRGGSVRLLLRALASDGATNILSTPSLVTLDNEEAKIHVGQNVPFITGSYSSTGTGGSTPTNPFQTIERKDVGILLKVKPQVNEGNAIKLEITQEVSSVDETSDAGLITNTRSIETSVLVDDGQMIVLGGLIKDDLQESEEKVPLLGDIPVLGNAFRGQRAKRVKTNLMVFLRPQILRDAALARSVTGGKYRFVRALQQEAGGDEVRLLGGRGPVMAPLEEQMGGAAAEPAAHEGAEAVPPAAESAPEAWSGWSWDEE